MMILGLMVAFFKVVMFTQFHCRSPQLTWCETQTFITDETYLKGQVYNLAILYQRPLIYWYSPSFRGLTTLHHPVWASVLPSDLNRGPLGSTEAHPEAHFWIFP